MARNPKKRRMARDRSEGLPWQAMKRYMAEHGYKSVADWAHKSGSQANTLYNWRKQNRVLYGTPLARLASHEGYEPTEFWVLLKHLAANDEASAGSQPPTPLQSLRDKKFLFAPRMPVLSLEHISAIRHQSISDAMLSSARHLPLPAKTDTVGAFEITDRSVDRVAPPGYYAIVDWSDRELLDGRYYLLTIDGHPAVRRLEQGRWEPDSRERWPDIQNDAHISVIGKVRAWHKIEEP